MLRCTLINLEKTKIQRAIWGILVRIRFTTTILPQSWANLTVSDWQIDCESFRKNPNPEPSFHMFKLISKISLRSERACQKWFLVTVTFLAPAIFQTVRLEKPLFYSKFWWSLLNFADGRFSIFCQNLIGLDLVFVYEQKSACSNASFLWDASPFISATFLPQIKWLPSH